MNDFETLRDILGQNEYIVNILERTPELQLSDWYVGAGGIAQTYWNYRHGFDLNHEIKDFDLAYFDPDTSYEAEDVFIKKGAELFKDSAVPVEIRNQARVHLWYKDHFGKAIDPYVSTEDAIDMWPTTATANAVRTEPDGEWKLYSPFGLEDLLNLVVRANKRKITKEIYEDKWRRWKKVWPKLTIIPW